MKQNNTQRYRNWSRRPFGWLKVAGALNHTCEQTDLSCDCLSSRETKYAIIIIVIITFKLITSLLSKQFLTQKCNLPGFGSYFIWYYLFLAQFCNFSAPRLRRLEKQGIAAAQQSFATPDQLAVLWLELPGLYSEAHSTMPLHTPIQGMSKWSGTYLKLSIYEFVEELIIRLYKRSAFKGLENIGKSIQTTLCI